MSIFSAPPVFTLGMLYTNPPLSTYDLDGFLPELPCMFRLAATRHRPYRWCLPMLWPVQRCE
eukprot:6173564-Pleurochrysis_carterae.AAC.1